MRCHDYDHGSGHAGDDRMRWNSDKDADKDTLVVGLDDTLHRWDSVMKTETW